MNELNEITKDIWFDEVMKDVWDYSQEYFTKLIAYEAEQEYLNENAN